MKKFITIVFAVMLVFGLASCQDHISIDNWPDLTPAEPTEQEVLFKDYTENVSWSRFMVNVGTLISGTPVTGMKITSGALIPTIEGTNATLPLTVTFTDFALDADNVVNGTVNLTYTGTIDKDNTTITATKLDAVFNVTLSKAVGHNPNSVDVLSVTYSGMGNIVNTAGTLESSVSLEIVNSVVAKLTGASLTSLIFPDAIVEY